MGVEREGARLRRLLIRRRQAGEGVSECVGDTELHLNAQWSLRLRDRRRSCQFPIRREFQSREQFERVAAFHAEIVANVGNMTVLPYARRLDASVVTTQRSIRFTSA